MKRLRTVYIVVGLCSCLDSENSEVAGPRAPLPPLPQQCTELPRFAEIEGRALEAQTELLRARNATVITPSNATDFEDYALDPALLETSIDAKREVARLFADAAEVPRADLARSVDWTQGSLLVHSRFAAVSSYTYAIAGDTLLVLVRRSEPCLDALRSKSFAPTPTMQLLQVPKLARVEVIAVAEAQFYQPAPEADGSCRSIETPVFSGGGDAAFSERQSPAASSRLFVNGFSAMTGNVFAVTANDEGVSFTPSGWDESVLGRFADRGPYADVFSPFVETLANRYRLTARLRERTNPNQSYIAEYVSTDGVQWGEGVRLLSGNYTAPLRLDDTHMMVGHGTSIARASREGDAWKLQSGAVLAPAPNTYYDFSTGEPELRVVNGRTMLWFVARTGGPSPVFSTIGVADAQPDGTFVPRAKPVLVPSRQDEIGGVSAPTIAVRGKEIWMYYTAINENAEPIVRRAVCTLE